MGGRGSGGGGGGKMAMYAAQTTNFGFGEFRKPDGTLVKIKAAAVTTNLGTKKETTILLKTMDGKNVGHITYEISHRGRIARVKTIEAAGSQGLGTRLYEKAMSNARKAGAAKFVSDKSVSEAAAKVWRKQIAKHGGREKVNRKSLGSRFEIDLE